MKQDEETLISLKQKNEQLLEQLKAERTSTMQLEQTLSEMEETLIHYKKSHLIRILEPRKIKQSVRNAVAYLLGRRNLKRIYSKAYKRKQASNDLLPYVRLLYEEGFVDKALADLQIMYEETSNSYLQRAIALELMLFYANKETKSAAKRALDYVEIAKKMETDEVLRRQLTIIEAECLIMVGEADKAKKVIYKELAQKHHPDLFLALANTEPYIDNRIHWLNECLSTYQLKPINIGTEQIDDNRLEYSVLHSVEIKAEEITGPKISVILPAYNAANSIHIAIESMLKQTWTNIELLIVDDCSTDGTYAVMEKYAEIDERIKLFQTEINSGPYVARNIALRAATGEFVTINDADDWSHREKLAVQVNHLLSEPGIIANTSEQVRLTTDFRFHRRGTRGKFIFSNMSSLMFRRKEVLDRIGFWDNVRFAADGEFKRRLIKEFGVDAVVDLKTGPLSFPEQSTASLTGNSAFGYAGFFMGARKEYVESFSHYHKNNKSLYYPFEYNRRLFPVPEPMLPNREKGERKLDVVIVANFYDMPELRTDIILKQIDRHKQLQLKTGLVQLYDYNIKQRKRSFNKKIRNVIDGNDVQMLVYGETISAEVLLIHSPESLQEKQQYIPKINNRITVIVIDELPKVKYNGKEKTIYNVRQIIRRSSEYFSSNFRIYPLDEQIRTELEVRYKRELGKIRLPKENWLVENGRMDESYEQRLNDWLVEQNDFKMT